MCGIRLGYVLNAAANQNQTTSLAAIRYLQQLMAEEVTGSRMEMFSSQQMGMARSKPIGTYDLTIERFEPQMIDDLHRKPTNLGVQDGPRLLAMSRCELCSIQALQS